MLMIAGGIILAYLVVAIATYRDVQRRKREYYRDLLEQRRNPLRGYDVNGYPL